MGHRGGLHVADSPADTNGDFLGQSHPNWADEPFSGSGPDPKGYIGDSASYVDEHERPDFIDVTDLDDDNGDIIKFNDSRSAPEQGPRHGSHYASLHYAEDDDTGYFNPANPTEEDWDQGDWVGHAENAVQNAGPANGDGMPQTPGHGGGDEEAVAGEGAAAGGEAAELAPLMLAASNGFSLDAFDRGEFAPEGDLRKAGRVGNGPTHKVRVDPGFRGQAKQSYADVAPPEDFGNNGEPDLDSYSGADPGNAVDIVAAFQRSAAADAVMSSQSTPDDFSSSPYVQSMLRTAGRKYSPEEQRVLEAESHPMGARNLPTDDDLQGTHYLLGL